MRSGDRWQMWLNDEPLLEVRISPRLTLPTIHLQGSFGAESTSIWIDNVEIRVPESALPEQRALEAVAEAFKRCKVPVLAIQFLAEREDMPQAERNLALEFARQRITTPSEQLVPLMEWAADAQGEATAAQGALAWLDDQSWYKEQRAEVTRLRAMLLYRASRFDDAFKAAADVARQRRKEQGSFHPTDVALASLAAHQAGEGAEARRYGRMLVDLLRSKRWRASPIMNRWIAEAHAMGVLPAEASAGEAKLLALTFELRRAALEDSDPEPLITALLPEAHITYGRGLEAGAYDVTLHASAFAAVERVLHLGKVSPVAQMVHEAVQVNGGDDRAEVNASVAWLRGQVTFRWDERWELVREENTWRVKSLRFMPTGYADGTTRWDVKEEGWASRDEAPERSDSTKLFEHILALEKAARYREAAAHTREWIAREPGNAMAHTYLALLSSFLGDVVTMKSAGREAARLAPEQPSIEFVHALGLHEQLIDSPLQLFGKALRVPRNWATQDARRVVGVPGTRAAWRPNGQSVLLVANLPKENESNNLAQLQTVLTDRYIKQLSCELVRARKRNFGEREALDVTFEGRGNGAAIIPSLSASASIATSTQIVAFDDGDGFTIFVLACPSQSLAMRTTELSTILEDLTSGSRRRDGQ
jgi:hypothetical protein